MRREAQIADLLLGRLIRRRCGRKARTEPRHPLTHARLVRHHETQRPDDVWRVAQQDFAFAQALRDRRTRNVRDSPPCTSLVLAEGVRGEIVLLDQQDPQAPPGGIARNAAPLMPPPMTSRS